MSIKVEEQVTALKEIADKHATHMENQKNQVEALKAALDQINAQLASFGNGVRLPTPMGSPPIPTPPLTYVSQLAPAQQAAVQADPRAVQGFLQPNGLALSPTPEHPARMLAHSRAGIEAAVLQARTNLNALSGLDPQFAQTLAQWETKALIDGLRGSGNLVMPDAPAGFQWRWYHVVGIGMMCALVGVGGVVVYQRYFRDKTT